MSKQHKIVETPKDDPESGGQALQVAQNVIGAGQVTITNFTVDELAADQGAGAQNITATDLSTPIISILQSNSPQCKRSDGAYIEGAVEGMLYNNVTHEVYDGEKGLQVIPCYFEKVYIEWKPNRGGLAAIHPVNTPLKDQVQMVKNSEGKEIPTLPNGNNLIETNQHYVLLLNDSGVPEAAVISMASSQLKPSRLWNTLIKKIQLQDSKGNFFVPASYYSVFKLTTQSRTKDKYSWFVWNVENMGPVPNRSLYDAGKALEKAVAGGNVKVKIDESANDGGAAPQDVDTPIPF